MRSGKESLLEAPIYLRTPPTSAKTTHCHIDKTTIITRHSHYNEDDEDDFLFSWQKSAKGRTAFFFGRTDICPKARPFWDLGI